MQNWLVNNFGENLHTFYAKGAINPGSNKTNIEINQGQVNL